MSFDLQVATNYIDKNCDFFYGWIVVDVLIVFDFVVVDFFFDYPAIPKETESILVGVFKSDDRLFVLVSVGEHNHQHQTLLLFVYEGEMLFFYLEFVNQAETDFRNALYFTYFVGIVEVPIIL